MVSVYLTWPGTVGVANSDAHNWMQPGQAGFTWVNSGNYSSTNRNAIWNAIRKGRVSASGRKDLGIFSINNAPQGSIVGVGESDNLNFRLVQQPVSGRKCTQITIRDMNNNIVKKISNPTSRVVNVSLPVQSSSAFYVVKYIFSTKSNKDYSHVWTNPIFVTIYYHT